MGEMDHHTHNVCDECLERIEIKRGKQNSRRRFQAQYEDLYLERAKQYAYDALSWQKEQFIVRENKRITKRRGLLKEEPMYKHYRNSCDECGGLLNSRTERWLIFVIPNQRRPCLLACKACFSHLAEKYFSEQKDKPTERIEEPKPQPMIQEISNEEEIFPLVNEPWWNIDHPTTESLLINHNNQLNQLFNDIKVIVDQPFF